MTDSIDDTLNYKRVAKRILAFVEASQFHLVETLAEHVAMLVLEEFGIALGAHHAEQARRGAQLRRMSVSRSSATPCSRHLACPRDR